MTYDPDDPDPYVAGVHDPNPVVSGGAGTWNPPSFAIGGWLSNGALAYLATGAGMMRTFDAMSNDEIVANLALEADGVPYDGSSLALRLSWAPFSTPDAGKTVKWEVDFAFLKDDGSENPYTKTSGATSDEIDLTGRTGQRQYVDVLSTMAGEAGATTLQITLRRLSQGPGADSFNDDADVFAIDLVKV